MKKNLIVLILILGAAGLCYASPVVTIESATILQGETTTIDVTLSGNATSGALAVSAFDFKVQYPTSNLGASNPLAGAALTSLGGTFAPPNTSTPGLISYIFYNLSDPIPAIPNGVLATFDITGLSIGSFPLTFFSINLGNVNSDDLSPSDFQTFSGTITVNAVPIPAAAWLLGSGLVGLVALKRRKKV